MFYFSLPPYHPDLNPIEMIWGIMKGRFAARNVDFGSNTADMLLKIRDEMAGITAEEWRRSCRHVWDQEDEYLRREVEEDNIEEPQELEVASNSESSESEDSE